MSSNQATPFNHVLPTLSSYIYSHQQYYKKNVKSIPVKAENFINLQPAANLQPVFTVLQFYIVNIFVNLWDPTE